MCVCVCVCARTCAHTREEVEGTAHTPSLKCMYIIHASTTYGGGMACVHRLADSVLVLGCCMARLRPLARVCRGHMLVQTCRICPAGVSLLPQAAAGPLLPLHTEQCLPALPSLRIILLHTRYEAPLHWLAAWLVSMTRHTAMLCCGVVASAAPLG